MTEIINSGRYEGSIEEINSFESYYKNVIFRNNNLIIPYMNLGVSEHPLNRTKELKHLDYAYMVFENVSYLSVYISKKRYIVCDQIRDLKYYFGGSYYDLDSCIFNDMEICSNQAYLHTIQSSRLSSDRWIPDVNRSFPLNTDLNINEQFFIGEFMPEIIKSLIE
jgi:hypothetical protein